MKKIFIEVRFQFEGHHHWLNAPNEVAFLRSYHRHMFHGRARIEVSHGDRDLEFILVKRDLEKHIQDDFGPDLGEQSCEQIADRLCLYLMSKYGVHNLEVEISEDGENGSVVRHSE